MTQQEIIYEFERVATIEGWWMWAILTAAIGVLLYVCVRYYRLDVQELSRPIRWTLVSLRLVTVLALVFFFLGLNRRTQRLMTRQSEVAILVDTSQSMSLPSTDSLTSASRTDFAQEILGQTELIDQLSSSHRVSVYAFGVPSEPKLLQVTGGQSAQEDRPQTTPSGASFLAQLGMLLVGLASLPRSLPS